MSLYKQVRFLGDANYLFKMEIVALVCAVLLSLSACLHRF